jgi:hypothetical protein
VSQGPGLEDLPDWPAYNPPTSDHAQRVAAAAPRDESTRLRVYLAGPMSAGDFMTNVHKGLWLGRKMLLDGMAPYIPHLDAYMFPRGGPGVDGELYETLMDWDFAWVQVSQAVFRMPGESPGADREVAVAKRLGIPVFTEYHALKRWARDNRKVDATC